MLDIDCSRGVEAYSNLVDRCLELVVAAPKTLMPSTGASHERTTHLAAGLPLLSDRFRSHSLLILLNLGLVLGIFLLDVLIATDIAIGMLYVAPVAWMTL